MLVLVHVDETELPPYLFVMTIEVESSAQFYEIEDSDLPNDRRITENIALEKIGDSIFKARKYIGIKARSAVMPQEYNLILNPLYPGYYDLIKVISVEDYQRDNRL
ncbi:hypothetical protein Dfri01_30730 [Dyadobacter frigoris]|nr:hypothetical protein Dfri01_30730 [Dyadobacter frigoris]